MKRARRSRLVVVALMLLALPVLAACGGGGGGGGSNQGNGDQAAGNKITVTAQNMSFDQTEITLKKGQTYTIELVNNDSVQHDLVSEQLGLEVGLTDPGQSNSVEFTPQQTGDFEFICSVPGHSATMKGTIRVTE
ncbi:blue (type 1) copper domain protein [Thermaerobacter marianensis DSM 12885]|uniref:Blue (Type 1) copper domain protein n=1 Tax=Thermaerobacter marianensis (strain ATCC 700841 / DSM 12885 / JCM 10246 / 7p75a) TaxID=644966 RepID=E6SGM4_THEM7|nr:cupredoxin domain-containing protein [Thermaerobacter marianensis]ADU50570.1 blue (type 1) copper domain protein [Thermaerobacter marianensis DSM 12885]